MPYLNLSPQAQTQASHGHSGPPPPLTVAAPPTRPCPPELRLFNGGSLSIGELQRVLPEDQVLYGLIRMGFGAGQFRRTKWVFLHWVGDKCRPRASPPPRWRCVSWTFPPPLEGGSPPANRLVPRAAAVFGQASVMGRAWVDKSMLGMDP